MSIDIQKAIDETFPNFKFRPRQRETIEEILGYYQENPSTQILVDAPTGSGKSIISVFSSVILNKYFKKSGYILTADTSLQGQYERDCREWGYDIPSIKGMDNYTCSVNHQVVSMGDCRIRNFPIPRIRELDCYQGCGYYKNRDDAIMADTAILNYNYWLMQQTHVNVKRDLDAQPFPIRDFTFFDEAHNVVDIVSNHFTPVIPMDLVEKIKNLFMYGLKCGVYDQKKMFELEKQIADLILSIKKSKNGKETAKRIKELVSALSVLNPVRNKLQVENDRLIQSGEVLPDMNKNATKYLYTLNNIIKTSANYFNMVKENPEDLIHKQYDEDKNQIRLYCGDESKIMTKYFHNYHNFGVYLSATFLDMDFFHTYAGFDEERFKKIELPHTFDYNKSPIYFTDKYSMSFSDRDHYIADQVKAIDDIVDKYPSGVIHTASKRNARYLVEHSRHGGKKIKTYETTKEKEHLLSLLKNRKSFFLAGPSLLEGLDLKGDISRCQIFMKTPYPNLGDTFVEHRKNKNDKWYKWLTALNFVQGLGRSMRKSDDYCDTYILDRGFKGIANGGFLPYEILTRIKKYEH